jgi:Retroviral aspartyl protease
MNLMTAMEVSEKEENESEELDSEEEDSEQHHIEEAIVSLHATSNNPTKTMRREAVGQKPISALLDSGRTHSFVDPTVLKGIPCSISKTTPMVVLGATGRKMVTDSRCDGLKYSLQGYSFESNLRLL